MPFRGSVWGVLIAAAGTIELVIGLIILAFNGHVEDYGSAPAQTWPFALAFLIASGITFLCGILSHARDGLRAAVGTTVVGIVLGLVALAAFWYLVL